MRHIIKTALLALTLFASSAFAHACPLCKPVIEGDFLKVQRLIHKEVDIFAEDFIGLTALDWATGKSGDPNIVRALVDAGALIGAVDYEGNLTKFGHQVLTPVDTRPPAVQDVLKKKLIEMGWSGERF